MLKYDFSWLAHHAESYSLFLANSIFQFKRNFINLNFWRKNFDLKIGFFVWLKYSFSWSADHAESYSAFVANSICQFQRNFFHLNFWRQNCDKFSFRDLFLRWFSMGLYTFSFQYLFHQSFTFTYITDHCIRTVLCSLFLSFSLNTTQLSHSPFYIIGLTLLRQMFTREV